MEGVVFRPPGAAGTKAADPIISIRTLTIESTFVGLFRKTKTIRRLVADGLSIHVPAGGAKLHSQGGSSGDQVLIEELRADDATLELARGDGGERGLVFPIHHALFRNVNGSSTIPFEVSLHLPVPPGEVESFGWIGPWSPKGTVRSTPVSGSYALKGATLDVFKGLGGQVSSRGQFTGNLERLAVSGATDAPAFLVKDGGHPTHISTQFRGAVDLRNGNVFLPQFQARLGKTNLAAHATIAGTPKKTVTLIVTEGKGDIQDLMMMFSSAPRPSITGPIVFHTQIVLPPEDRIFKERLQLAAEFIIDPARFSDAHTQMSIDQLSERAEGKKDKGKDFDKDDDESGYERVLTNLKGDVRLRNGTAAFSLISFSVPGAQARMRGTYGLVNKRVNFRGTMRMQATVSQATTGKKSFFLKAIDPFYKKRGAGAELPVTMTGSYGNTHFGAALK